MTTDKPVMIMRGLSGDWYAVTHWKPLKEGGFLAINKRPIDPNSAKQLDEMANAKGWLDAVLSASGMTRDELADRLDLDVREMK